MPAEPQLRNTTQKTGQFDVATARADFPILSRQIHGKPLVYLDNAASAQKPKAVLDAMANVYETSYANVHRGVHQLSSEATLAYEEARATVARFVNSAKPEEIIFTKGGTEAINLVASCLGPEIAEGDEIILSDMEHHSNIVPWHFLRARNRAVLKWTPLTEADDFDLDTFARLLSPRTKLVAVTHMSNVLGTITPLTEIIRLAHAAGAFVLIDGCQGAVHETIDVQALGCDFYVATGHKLYGPSGIGFLYGKSQHLRRLQPYQGGGEMINVVTHESVTYADHPYKFEAGTPPIVPAIGLGAALNYLLSLDRSSIAEHEAELLDHATIELNKLAGVKILGRSRAKGSLATFHVDGIHPHDIATMLDCDGIAVRAGNHCAQPLMERLGVPSTTRASFAFYNTHTEVEALISSLKRVLEFFR